MCQAQCWMVCICNFSNSNNSMKSFFFSDQATKTHSLRHYWKLQNQDLNLSIHHSMLPLFTLHCFLPNAPCSSHHHFIYSSVFPDFPQTCGKCQISWSNLLSVRFSVKIHQWCNYCEYAGRNSLQSICPAMRNLHKGYLVEPTFFGNRNEPGTYKISQDSLSNLSPFKRARSSEK
jgi:hypothetical protein